jgi:hypothetical protein
LKRTHDELSRAVASKGRANGDAVRLHAAERILVGMDRELRKALLEYGQMSRAEMSMCLREAVSMALSVAETLKTTLVL